MTTISARRKRAERRIMPNIQPDGNLSNGQPTSEVADYTGICRSVYLSIHLSVCLSGSRCIGRYRYGYCYRQETCQRATSEGLSLSLSLSLCASIGIHRSPRIYAQGLYSKNSGPLYHADFKILRKDKLGLSWPDFGMVSPCP